MLRENRDEFLSSCSYSYSLLSSKLSWVERVKIPTVGLGIIRYELFHLNNQSSRSLEKFPTFQKSTRQSSNGIILFFLWFSFSEKKWRVVAVEWKRKMKGGAGMIERAINGSHE